MKIVELLIDQLDNLTGIDAVALVENPAIEADFYAFKDTDIEDTILFNLIKLEVKEQFDETEDSGELTIEGYQTRHWDMCPGATSLYEAIIRGDHGDIDKDLLVRAAKLQDALFYLEKHTVKEMGSATIEDVVSAQNLADEIMILADMMGLREQHSYIQSHVDAIKELANVQFESYTDYPESSTNAAKRALEWRDSHPDNDCGTRVGWARANQLANREPISEETIARMASFARHLQYEDVPYSEGCGGLMVDAWGGRAGIEWAKNKLDRIRTEASKFSFSEDQQMVVGPLMIPNKLILRVDENGDPFYVYFSEKTIESVARKMMYDKKLDDVNLEHQQDAIVDGHLVETWLIEDPEKDKQNVYNMSFPKGTWMGQYKINDPEVWNMVKQGKLKGFSIEGFFADRFVQAKK